jgi:radical SAM-linked protein
MTHTPPPAPTPPPVRHRLRFRFAKTGDIRLISHRDLLRAMERLFRRANLPLGMSQGFRPKPRMTFPSALAVGIAGLDEVMELELAEVLPADEVLARLQQTSPPGLGFKSAEVVPPGSKTTQACRAIFEIGLPTERIQAASEAAARFLSQTAVACRREDKDRTIDLRPLVEDITVTGDVVRLTLKVAQEGAARPREVLEALGLADLESAGFVLTRTGVELAARPATGPGEAVGGAREAAEGARETAEEAGEAAAGAE